jgi:hypothetical protein
MCLEGCRRKFSGCNTFGAASVMFGAACCCCDSQTKNINYCGCLVPCIARTVKVVEGLLFSEIYGDAHLAFIFTFAATMYWQLARHKKICILRKTEEVCDISKCILFSFTYIIHLDAHLLQLWIDCCKYNRTHTALPEVCFSFYCIKYSLHFSVTNESYSF